MSDFFAGVLLLLPVQLKVQLTASHAGHGRTLLISDSQRHLVSHRQGFKRPDAVGMRVCVLRDISLCVGLIFIPSIGVFL